MCGFGKVNISNSELEKLKKIGEGNDAIVYDAGKGILYKVYKGESMSNYLNKPTRIYKGERKNIDERLLYLDKDGVKIYYKDAFKRIIKRGEKIKLSNLPKASLFIDNKFKGCVLEKINGFQIHNIFPILSKKIKYKILKELLNEIKELTDNYIYPIDTANSPRVDNHSNILVNYKLEPKLIDLDGKSTLYRESYDDECYLFTLMSLNLLFMELLNDIEIGYQNDQIELDYIKKILMRKGINEELAHKISRYKANYDELDNFAKLYLKIK